MYPVEVLLSHLMPQFTCIIGFWEHTRIQGGRLWGALKPPFVFASNMFVCIMYIDWLGGLCCVSTPLRLQSLSNKQQKITGKTVL